MIGMFKSLLYEFQGTATVKKSYSNSGAHIWNVALSDIETGYAFYTFKALCTNLLNEKEGLSPNWINMNIFHVQEYEYYAYRYYSMNYYYIFPYPEIC